MSGAGEQVVFLHGLGVGPESWEAQLSALPAGYQGFAPPLPGLVVAEPGFSLSSAAAGVVDEMRRRGIDRAHVCGLSLGAMVATQIVVDDPDHVVSLTLSGGQVHPPRLLMTVQSAVMRLLPERAVVSSGMTKKRMLQVLKAVAETDFRPVLSRIKAPTLVMCGARDRANLPAARALAAGIPDARLGLIDGGHHELNTDMPAEFNAELFAFLDTARRG